MKGGVRTLHDLVACLSGDVREPRDWRALVALASETLTIGSLADALLPSAIASEIPKEVGALLIEVQKRARKRNARIRAQFFELLPALNAAEIEPIPMRGAARLLSSMDEESRLLSDIDLLVPEDRLGDCTHALRELGYNLVGGPQEEHLSTEFARSRDVGMVDLHTQLKPLYLRVGYDRLASECRSTQFPTGRALLPSSTCQMLFTIVHDQLHDGDYWRGLFDVRHLVDMSRIAAEPVDWDKLASFFPVGSPRNALFVQLRSAHALMKMDIPDPYCGGAWSELQQVRRRVQARFTGLGPLFTVLTIAADRPLSSRAMRAHQGTISEHLHDRLVHYFRPTNPGKFSFRG